MARFTETEKSVRKMIMDQVLSSGTCPKKAELARAHNLTDEQITVIFKNLEAGICIAVQNKKHANMKTFQGEKLEEPLPELGEVFYARPFACFKNHYKIWVDGKQKWCAECAVEACGISHMFPGKVVVLESHCRETREPVMIAGRDNRLLGYSPKTLRVHFGFALQHMPDDILGWCDFNSFFASEEAARAWQKKHPGVKGVTRGVETTNKFIVELVGKGRLDYDYQPTMPLGRLLIQPGRYGFTKPGLFGLPTIDSFFLPTSYMIREMKKKGFKNYTRFSLL